MSYIYFVIIGQNDNPLFEIVYNPVSLMNRISSPDPYDQFRAFAALDQIHEDIKNSSTPYLKSVDKFNEWIVNVFISPARLKFVFLHTGQNDDKIKNFLYDAYDTYVKFSLNPFYKHGQELKSSNFTKRIVEHFQKHF